MGQDPEQPQQPQGQPPTPGGAPMSPQGQPLAEWWKRLIAAIIDGFIIGIPANIIGGIVFSGIFAASTPTFDPTTGQITGGEAGFFAGILAAWGAFILMYWILTAAYYTYLHASRGQTVGKMAMKIKVVEEASGGNISFGMAFVRWLIPFPIGLITCGIGALLDGLWPLWDPKRQAIHDKVAKSLVIDAA
jgi:uncharacterized RDD family membrane protein YckC